MTAIARTRAARTYPPGPPSQLVNTYRSWRDPLGCHDAWLARYGDPYSVRILGHRMVLSVEPATIRAFFHASPRTQGLFGGKAARPTGGPLSLIQEIGAAHVTKRRHIVPAITGAALRAAGPALRRSAERCFAAGAERPTVAAFDLALDFAIDAMLEMVGLGASPRRAELIESVRLAHLRLSAPYLFVPAWHDNWIGKLMFFRTRGALARCVSLLAAEIERARADAARGALSLDDTLLGRLETLTDEAGAPLSAAQILDHVRTAIFGGIESSTASMAFMVDLVFRRPDVVERLRGELAAVDATDGIDEWIDAPYLQATVNEAFRYYPVTGLVLHELGEDATINGYDIPRGTGVGANVYALHRRADIYERPEAFAPERFLGWKPPPYSFLPFGGGARVCIGAQLADIEARIFVALLARSFRVTPVHRRPSRIVRRPLVASPADGVPVRLERR